MVSAALVQARIDKGRGIAASKIGLPYTLYRPSSAFTPLGTGNAVGVVNVLLDASFPATFSRPNLYAKPVWQAIMDASQVRPGDYITADSGTYFIAAAQSLLPVAVVECNRLLAVLRPTGNAGLGAQPYGGDIASAETPLMTAWPASMLQGTKGERGDSALPGDTRFPWVAILMPAWPGVTINAADVITDDLGRRWKVSAAELSDLGWRLTAALATT